MSDVAFCLAHHVPVANHGATSALPIVVCQDLITQSERTFNLRTMIHIDTKYPVLQNA